ncbi:hypothetical protein [Cylindrospermopsis raciborskii]|nr:hypothetical protein [Cylindrospermopsis raciborskii]
MLLFPNSSIQQVIFILGNREQGMRNKAIYILLFYTLGLNLFTSSHCQKRSRPYPIPRKGELTVSELALACSQKC